MIVLAHAGIPCDLETALGVGGVGAAVFAFRWIWARWTVFKKMFTR